MPVALFFALLFTARASAQAPDPHDLPVKSIGPRAFTVAAPGGSGTIRYFGTASIDGDRQAERVIVVIPGLLRNADSYESGAEAVLEAAPGAAARTVVITPQFLAAVDVEAHGLPAGTLRWSVHSWLEGEPALGPAPLSAFDVLDAMIARLNDRDRFPALKEVVVAGHSAGGQLVQRYAVVGRPAARSAGLRFVVSNPSSYLYFSDERPQGDGRFAAPSDAAVCPQYNRWKYGLAGAPPYVRVDPDLESEYAGRHVTYLLGLLDVDPDQAVLDKSCAGELQGPWRLARGRNYADYLRSRHPQGTSQEVVEVPGVGHDGPRMFESPCGVAVLLGMPLKGCAARSI